LHLIPSKEQLTDGQQTRSSLNYFSVETLWNIISLPQPTIGMIRLIM